MKFIGQLKKLDNNGNATDVGCWSVLTILGKKYGNEIKISSRKYDRFVKDGKLSRGESKSNKYTIKQIKVCSKK